MRIDRIKLIVEMAKRDMDIKTLAEKSKLSRATITAVKGGKSCTEATGYLIAQGLGVDVTELLED